MRTEFTDIESALHQQWDRLSSWLDENEQPITLYGAAASSVPDWSRIELIAHLARAFEALTVCEPAPAGTIPLSLAEYLGTYPQRAAQITQVTKQIATEHPDDLLSYLRTSARQAFTRLGELTAAAGTAQIDDPGKLVVQARRAPVQLRDMVVSRLIELVVHTYDIADSYGQVIDIRGENRPMDVQAEQIVADELLQIVIAREGWNLSVADPGLWNRLATGRQSYDVDLLSRALTTTFTSDSIPDLGRMLPIT